MSLTVNHPDADRLAHELVERTGEGRRRVRRREDRLALGQECAALPDYDTRTSDEILGYDEHDIPS